MDGVERRAAGFAYIQGSGDDHELWGMVGIPSHLDALGLLSQRRVSSLFLPGSHSDLVLEVPRRDLDLATL
jgi:hypothetical protein